MKVKALLAMVVISTLLLGGCSVHKKPYAYDDDKSYAYNMLDATTARKLCIKDRPLRNRGSIGSAALAGYGALGTNSLSHFGVSSGAEAGLAAGLILFGANDYYKPGKDSRIFGWIPRQGLTHEQAKEKIEEAIYQAMLEAVKSTTLPEGYFFTEVSKGITEDSFFGASPAVEALVSGPSCGSETTYCSFLIPSFSFGVIPSFEPEILGGEAAWFFCCRLYDNGERLRNGATEELKVEFRKNKSKFNLWDYEFFEHLSANLPSNYFFYMAPYNKFSKLEMNNGEKATIPLMFSKGETFYFTPPEKSKHWGLFSK